MFSTQFVSFVLIVASVAAFQTVRVSRPATSLAAAKSKSLPFLPQPPNLVGLTGEVGFDPVGFSNIFDIKWLSEAEIKHSRVAMLGVLGFIGTSFYHLPGDVHEVTAVAAHDAAVKSGSLGQVLLWTSLFEILSFKAVTQMLEGSGRAPGDFGFDPLNLSKGDKTKYAVNELKNGRLAMLAFSGLITQAVLTGKEFPYASY